MIGFLWDYWPWVLLGTAATAGLIAFSYITQNWRWILAVGPIVAALFAVGRAHRQGAAYEREQLARRNDAARRRAERDAVDVSRMSNDDLDKELKRWGKH